MVLPSRVLNIVTNIADVCRCWSPSSVEAVYSSETSVSAHKPTRRYNPENRPASAPSWEPQISWIQMKPINIVSWRSIGGRLFTYLSLPSERLTNTASHFRTKNIYSVNLVEFWDLIPRYVQRENWISSFIYTDDSANINPKACDDKILCIAKP
jgi:hypothetical protein